MKIIKEGVPYVWLQEFTCLGKKSGKPGCGAVLLVTEEDLYRTVTKEYYDGYYDLNHICFSCPCCSCENEVKVPEHVEPRGMCPKRKKDE